MTNRNSPRRKYVGDFCESILTMVGRGEGITPFVGSGLSKKSGILMGQEFTNYLAFTIYRSLNEKFSVRESGWPALPSTNQIRNTKRWFLKEYRRSCRLVGIEVKDIENKVSELKPDSPLAAMHNNPSRPLVPEILSTNSTWGKRQTAVTAS